MLEDESRQLPPDPKLDQILRVITISILLVGGGYLTLEFSHWLVHGGFPKLLKGSIFIGGLLLFAALVSGKIAHWLRAAIERPMLGIVLATGTAGAFLVIHLLS